MAIENRVREILRCVDELLRRMERWLQDPRGGPIVPGDVAAGIHSAVLICGRPEIPACCRDLATVAVPRLAEELRGYQQRELGRVRPENGAPGPSFWAAAKAVARARAEAETPLVEQFEPVAVLLQQGVTHEQIARHIYGRRGVGPFLKPGGMPDVSLIEQEARQPGSVIPAAWIPPWHQELVNRRQRDLARTLSAFDGRELARHYDDPATVEQLLRDGAFVQQIERAKGVTREEVLEAARSIGITPVDGPGYHPGTRDLTASDPDDDDSTAAAAADRQALRSLILELYAQSAGSRRPSDIAAELRQRGHNVSTNTVSAIVGHWKKRAASGAAAG